MPVPSWSFSNGVIHDPGNNWTYDLSKQLNSAQNLDQAMTLAKNDWQARFDPSRLVLSNALTAAGQGIQGQAKDWGDTQTWNANPFLSRPDLAASTPGGGGTGATAPLNPWGQPQGTPRPANALASAATPGGGSTDQFASRRFPGVTSPPPSGADPFQDSSFGNVGQPGGSTGIPGPVINRGGGLPPGTDQFSSRVDSRVPNLTRNIGGGQPPVVPPNQPPGGSGGGQPRNPLQNPPYWSSNNDPRMYVLNPNASGSSITIGNHVYAPTDPRPYYDPNTGHTLFMNPQTGAWTDGSGNVVSDPRGGGQPPNTPPSRGDYMGYGPNAGGLRVDPNYVPENWNYKETPEYQWIQAQAEKGLNRRLLAAGRSDSTGGINALANLRSNIAASEVDKQYQRALQANQENYGRYFNANLTNYGRTQGEDTTGYNRAQYADATNFGRQSYLGAEDWNQNYQLAQLGLDATKTGASAGNATAQSLATLFSQNGFNQASLALARGDVTADQINRLIQQGLSLAQINGMFSGGSTNALGSIAGGGGSNIGAYGSAGGLYPANYGNGSGGTYNPNLPAGGQYF